MIDEVQPEAVNKPAIDPVTGSLIAQGLVTSVDAVTKGGPRRQYKWNKRAAEDANKMNRENAEWAYEQNRKIQEEQRLYDSPAEQMARYKAAGLNPNMIYGNGGAAGGAFPIQFGSIAPARLDPPSAAYPNVAGTFLGAGQTLAQTQLIAAKESESISAAALKQALTDVARANPMLDHDVYEQVARSMKNLADLKASESSYLKNAWVTGNDKISGRAYAIKIDADIEKMFQSLGLGEQQLENMRADKALKNRVLESKEFENALKEIQVNWMKNKEITPQHIYQGLMLILSKML